VPYDEADEPRAVHVTPDQRMSDWLGERETSTIHSSGKHHRIKRNHVGGILRSGNAKLSIYRWVLYADVMVVGSRYREEGTQEVEVALAISGLKMAESDLGSEPGQT
jgi:hypothetical protein